MKKILLMLFVNFIIVRAISLNIEYNKINEFNQISSFAGEKSILVIENTLFSYTEYGLEIYEIDTSGDVELRSKLPIVYIQSMIYNEDYIYVTTAKWDFDNIPNRILKIDVSDLDNPSVSLEHVINDDFYYRKLEIFDNYLMLYHRTTDENYNVISKNYIFDTNSLDILYEFEDLIGQPWKISESKCIAPRGYNQYEIIDLSDIENPSSVGYGDIDSQHDFNCFNIDAVNDTILYAVSAYNISFWDISDSYNWELINSIQLDNLLMNSGDCSIVDNLLFVPICEEALVINLESFEIESSASYETNTFTGYASTETYANYFYIADRFSGIRKFSLLNNELQFCNRITSNVLPYDFRNYQDYIIQNHFCQQISYYNISNLNNISEKITLDLDSQYYVITIIGNYIFCSDNFGIDIYDISNINQPLFISRIDNEIVYQFIDTGQNEQLYFQNSMNSIKKYDISDVYSPQLKYELEVNFNIYNTIVVDDYIYICEENLGRQTLHIFSGANNTMPVIENTIYDISNMPTGYLGITGNYITMMYFAVSEHPDQGVKFYSIDDPINPEFIFQTSISGKVNLIDDNIATVLTGNSCYFYDISDNPTGTIEPIGSMIDTGTGRFVYSRDWNGNKYFIYAQDSSIGIYEYNVTVGNNNTEIALISPTLSNYPNPFSPETAGSRSASTTINYSLATAAEAEIIIYNLKGQKIKTLLSQQQPAGEHSVSWDGKNSSGKAVASGVYLYQLQLDGQSVARQKMMLVK